MSTAAPPRPPADVDSAPFWQRILPKSILGLATLLLFMSIASAFSGAVLFAYYQFEISETQDRIDVYESRIADDLEAAKQILDTERDKALDQIDTQLSELEKFAASGATVADLLADVADSVYFVNTLDENGQPSVGTAFVFVSDSERSFLITSYTTIRAATREPAPSISVRNNSGEIPIVLNGWDEGRDLALLIADVPNLPEITLGTPSSVNVGDRVFAVSGLGASGGSITQGVVADVSANALQHDTNIGAHFQGGPLLNSGGELVGIASRAYAPLGFDPKAVFFGIPWREACNKVLDCPSDIGGG